MKRLTRLHDNPTYLQRYASIRDSKHNPTRAALLAVQANVEAQYAAFAQAAVGNQFATIEPDPACRAAMSALRACYDGPTKALRSLKQELKDAQLPRQLKYCPMCGTTLPGTIDHYMPAVRFPEYAVHPLNLVPCCSSCNSIKDDDWLSANGRRQFVHAYFDEAPDVDFLLVVLHESAGIYGVGATFRIERPRGVDADSWELISSHFARLRLIERFNELGNDEIAEIVANCRVFLKSGGVNVVEFLMGVGVDRAEVYGRNHWRAVLTRAMAAHPSLGEWLE